MGLGELLEVVEPGGQLILVVLGQADPKHVQDHLGVLGVVLVPAVVQGLPGPGQRHRGDQAQLDTGLDQTPDEGAVVVARRLEAGDDRTPEGTQSFNQAVVLDARVEDRQTAPARPVWTLYQNLVTVFGDIDRYKSSVCWRRLMLGHGRSVSKVCDGTQSL